MTLMFKRICLLTFRGVRTTFKDRPTELLTDIRESQMTTEYKSHCSVLHIYIYSYALMLRYIMYQFFGIQNIGYLSKCCHHILYYCKKIREMSADFFNVPRSVYMSCRLQSAFLCYSPFFSNFVLRILDSYIGVHEKNLGNKVMCFSSELVL